MLAVSNEACHEGFGRVRNLTHAVDAVFSRDASVRREELSLLKVLRGDSNCHAKDSLNAIAEGSLLSLTWHCKAKTFKGITS